MGLVSLLAVGCGSFRQPAPGEFRFPLRDLAAPESVTTVRLADYDMTSQFARVAYVVRLSDGQMLVFSGTDLMGGCTVVWDGRENLFRNPCHGSVYSMRGEVLAGPARQGLGVFTDYVEDEMLVADMSVAPVPVTAK